MLPKEGKRFNHVIRALRNAGVDTMAGHYFDLRGRVISWYHDHVLNGDLSDDATTLERTPLPSSAYLEADRTTLLADAAESPFDQDPCLSRSYPLSLPDLSSTD